MKSSISIQYTILFIFCLIFVCVKIPYLNLPFYWDEAWVYAPAIKAMAHNGIGLLPNALSDSFSRGHPLLFFFTGALWVKVFGESLVSMHLFAIAIAISFALVFFYIIKRLFDPILALICTAILLVQPIFIAQSGLVLPEVFLALWAILSVYHFIKGNRYYYILFATLLLLTKESGVVIIAALCIYEVVSFFIEGISLYSVKSFIQKSLLTIIPLLVLIAFLILQHKQRGYYFYPEHIADVNLSWVSFQETLKTSYSYLFELNRRTFITWSFLIVFGLLYEPIPLAVRLFLVFGMMACVKIFFNYWELPDLLMVIVIVLFTSGLYYFMHIKYADKARPADKALAIIFITGALYLMFSSINFFSYRYLFMLVPLMLLYFTYYIKTSLQDLPFLYYSWTLGIVVLMVCGDIAGYNDLGDTFPQYIQAVKVEQGVIHYMEEQNLQGSNIYGTFTINNALTDLGSGYLEGNRPFTDAKGTFDKSTEYVIQTNIEPDAKGNLIRHELVNFKLVRDFDCGGANIKLFKRVL